MPRWLRAKEAARYSSIGAKRLKTLAQDDSSPVVGFPDPDSGRGDWIFDRVSLDDYRLAQAGQEAVQEAALDVLDRSGLR